MFKRFIYYYRPHLAIFVLDFGCAFLMAGLDLVFPMVVRTVIDKVLPAADLQLLAWTGVGLFALFGAKASLQYAVDYWGHVLGTRMQYHMRKDMFDHVQKLSFSYFDNTKTGHIMSRMVNDLTEISELAHHGPEDLFIASVTLLGSFAILASMNWQLAVITFAIVPVMVWFLSATNVKMRAAFQDVRVKIADVNAQVEDSVSGIRVVKSFANEEYEAEKFNRGNSRFRLSLETVYKVMAGFYAGMDFFSNVLYVVVLIGGGYFIYTGQLTTGEFVGFLLFVSIFLQPIKRINTLMEHYQRGMAGFRRFDEIMNLEPDILDTPGAKELGRVKGEIRFENVTFSYNNKENVLEGINLHVQPGETLALVGPSGGGKTTLCSLIPRFYETSKGQVTVDGTDIREVTQGSLRDQIGIVQQDVFLFSDTIRENIAYGKVGATDEEIVAAAKRAHAHEFVMSLENGYDTYIGERGVKLSGGQKQRIAIARIFLKNPPILILDEATSALDNETEKAVQKALTELSESRTTLVIAHRLATIRNADRIVVLADEGIVEQGTHDELLSRGGTYARLYRAQFEGFLPDSA